MTRPTAKKPRQFKEYRDAQRYADKMRPAPGKVVHHPRACSKFPGLHVRMSDPVDDEVGFNHFHGTTGCNETLTLSEPYYTVKPLGPVAAAKRLHELEFIAKLRKSLKPGDTIYTKLLHRASSGMFRVVEVMTIKGGTPSYYTRWVCWAGIADWNEKHEGAAAPGCGTDVGFEIVYAMGRALYPDGYTCPGAKCRSNDHWNDRTLPPRSQTKGMKHTNDGGYAFEHRWL